MQQVITGRGILAPYANEVGVLSDKLAAGEPAYSTLEGERWGDFKGFRTTTGGVIGVKYRSQIAENALELGINVGQYRDCEMFAAWAVRKALEEAGLYPFDSGLKFGLVFGTNFGNATGISPMLKEYGNEGDVMPYIDNYQFGNIAQIVAGAFDITGPVCALSLSCASGASVIAQGSRWIREYGLDGVIACAADVLDVYIFSGLHSLRAMSPDNIVRPWDANRKGTIFGEGAGAVILMTPEAAEKTGAKGLAVLRATYQNNDGFHLSAPDTTASGISELISNALVSAGVELDEVDFINLHGTGTVYNDRIETKAIVNVFGEERARDIPITANKGSLGHLMGAAGIVETVSTITSLIDGFIPPTANILELDPALTMNIVQNEGLKGEFRIAVKNSFGIGGANACLVLEKI